MDKNPLPQVASFYREDLAYVHDVGFGTFARSASRGLLELLRRDGKLRGLVVDLGCGSGMLAKEFSDAGYEVLGIDISAAMIDVARKRVSKGQFRKESLFAAQLPSCVAVTAIGDGIRRYIVYDCSRPRTWQVNFGALVFGFAFFPAMASCGSQPDISAFWRASHYRREIPPTEYRTEEFGDTSCRGLL